MKLTFCIIAAAYLAVDLCVWHGPVDRAVTALLERPAHIVVRVHGQSLTEEDIDHATLEQLFRQGQDWNAMAESSRASARLRVQEKLVDDAVIRAARLADASAAPSAAGADDEIRTFLKQFPLETDYPERLPLQHLTESRLRARMKASIDDQAWVEKQIAPQLASITDDAAKAWYLVHRAELAVPESFHAIHLFLGDHEKDPKNDPDREPEIKALYQQLLSGAATLGALATNLSDDERSKKTGGDLGWFTAAHVPADFMAAVTALKSGEMSHPVHTHLGWHVIKVLEKKGGRVPTFEEVRGEVAAKLQNQHRDNACQALIARLRAKYVAP